MESINEIIKFLRSEKERWDKHSGVSVNFKDVKTDLCHKASSWIEFHDGSGEIKIYEESSIPYSDDFDLAGVGKDVLLGGSALLIPVVGPLIAGGIIGLRGGKTIGAAAFTGFSWRNTYVFVFNSSKECVFAIEIHYFKGSYFIQEILRDIEHTVKNLEAPSYEYEEYEEYEDEESENYEDGEYEDYEDGDRGHEDEE